MVINGIHFTTRSTDLARWCEVRCLNPVFQIEDVVMYGVGFRREIDLILQTQTDTKNRFYIIW